MFAEERKKHLTDLAKKEGTTLNKLEADRKNYSMEALRQDRQVLKQQYAQTYESGKQFALDIAVSTVLTAEHAWDTATAVFTSFDVAKEATAKATKK